MYKLGHEDVVHRIYIKMRRYVYRISCQYFFMYRIGDQEEASVQNRSPEIYARVAKKYIEINLPRRSK